MFIVPDVNVRASVQMINMGDKLDINHLSSEVGLVAQTVCLLSVMVML